MNNRTKLELNSTQPSTTVQLARHLGVFDATILASSRVAFSMGRDWMLPKKPRLKIASFITQSLTSHVM